MPGPKDTYEDLNSPEMLQALSRAAEAKAEILAARAAENPKFEAAAAAALRELKKATRRLEGLEEDDESPSVQTDTDPDASAKTTAAKTAPKN